LQRTDVAAQHGSRQAFLLIFDAPEAGHLTDQLPERLVEAPAPVIGVGMLKYSLGVAEKRCRLTSLM
jgi:hypothetical protein